MLPKYAGTMSGNLVRDKGQQERRLFGTASSEQNTGGKVGLNGTGDTVAKDTERTLLKTFHTCVFTGSCGTQ